MPQKVINNVLCILCPRWRKAHDGVVARGLTRKEFEERASLIDIRLRYVYFWLAENMS